MAFRMSQRGRASDVCGPTLKGWSGCAPPFHGAHPLLPLANEKWRSEIRLQAVARVSMRLTHWASARAEAIINSADALSHRTAEASLTLECWPVIGTYIISGASIRNAIHLSIFDKFSIALAWSPIIGRSLS